MSVPPAMVEVCTAFDVNGVCTTSAWMPYGGGGAFPPLSLADAEVLGLAVATLWAVAYGFRLLKKTLAIG